MKHSYLSDRSNVTKSIHFDKILKAVKENNTLPVKEIWSRFVVPLDHNIGYQTFLKWKRKFDKATRDIAKQVVQSAIADNVNEEMNRVILSNEVDKLANEKLNDPEARKKISLGETMKLKIETEKLKQKDREIDIKENTDARHESMFELLVNKTIAGEVEEDDLDNLIYEASKEEALATEGGPKELTEGQA